MSNETPGLPIKIVIPGGSGKVEVASAAFYRTQYNSNIQIVIPAGSSSGGLTVNNIFPILPSGTFNISASTDTVIANPQYFNVVNAVNIVHNIKLLVKMQKTDGTNYSNYRELRCYPTKLDGTPYNVSVGANSQPATGDLADIFIAGKISHSIGDNITLGFQVAQVSGASSDTLLTIFRIDWLAMTV